MTNRKMAYNLYIKIYMNTFLIDIGLTRVSSFFLWLLEEMNTID